jgi:hypothetical protein
MGHTPIQLALARTVLHITTLELVAGKKAYQFWNSEDLGPTSWQHWWGKTPERKVWKVCRLKE